MVDVAEHLLFDGDLDDFGRLLHESWLLKRSISSAVSNGYLDDIYERARTAGAVGGKVVGAGGGGFMLLFVPPELQQNVKEALPDMVWVPFGMSTDGSRIIHYTQP